MNKMQIINEIRLYGLNKRIARVQKKLDNYYETPEGKNSLCSTLSFSGIILDKYRSKLMDKLNNLESSANKLTYVMCISI